MAKRRSVGLTEWVDNATTYKCDIADQLVISRQHLDRVLETDHCITVVVESGVIVDAYRDKGRERVFGFKG